MKELVLMSQSGHVATLAFNSPENGNALDFDMYAALKEKLEACEADEDVRVVVLTGMGKHFCAGGDIRQFKSRITDKVYLTKEELRYAADTAYQIRSFTKPTVAVVNHAAAGAGFSIACACDFRIVTPKTSFIMAFINVGLCSDTGGLYLLGKLVGAGRAAEIMMTGRPVGGEEAVQIGLANQCVPEEELTQAGAQFAARLAKGPGKALACQKQLINKYFYEDGFRAYAEDEAEANHLCSKSRDFEEAVDAFIEKRKPVFTGK